MSMVNLTEHIVGNAVDPNRIAAQIVSGIGFLGAGAIIQGRGSVTGLTTAATMWVVAAIGYTIGTGHIMVASMFSVTVLVVLRVINPLNKFIERTSEYKNYHLEVLTYGNCLSTVQNFLDRERVDITSITREDTQNDSGLKILNVILKAHPKCMERVSSELTSSVKVKEINHYEINDIEKYLETERQELKQAS
jgi:putative Mg2+ transporter-C (MgtC) family protein